MPPTPTPTPNARRPLRILVCDRPGAARTSLEQVLTRVGHAVRSASDPAAARAALEHKTAHVILLRVPFAGRVREAVTALRGRCPDAAILALSTGHAAAAVEALHCGADEFLGWPGAPDELLSRIDVARQRRLLTNENGDLHARIEQYETERRTAARVLHYQASHDLLTGLPNRTLLRDRLELALRRARRGGPAVTVFAVGVDRFKAVNDALGSPIGDGLLRAFGQRLHALLRDGETLARTGGDEFNLVLPGLGTQNQRAAHAAALLEWITEPFEVSGHQLFVTASIGIACAGAGDADALLNAAAVAMSLHKAAGRNGVRFYDPAIDGPDARRRSFVLELREALRAGQFRLHYQPQVDTATGQITDVEALVRWQHPRLGLIGPGEFLPVAEECGAIIPIGTWVLQRACEDLAAWRAAGVDSVRLAVNCAPEQVAQPGFVGTVMRTLHAAGVPPSDLAIEITENGLLRDVPDVASKLRTLAEQGVSIAVDDFGTGYSSFGWLRSLPVQQLKIDRSFVQDLDGPDGESLLRAMVSMARDLRLTTIAEGVESAEQRNALCALGCGRMQGFLFSRPVDADAALALLRSGVADGTLPNGHVSESAPQSVRPDTGPDGMAVVSSDPDHEPGVHDESH